MRLLLVVAGGGFGSAARYLAGNWISADHGWGFPWATLAINIAGSLAIGVIATLSDETATFGPQTRALLVVGVLGGFTTFSAFSLETVRLLEDGHIARALGYISGSVAASVAACGLGVWVTRSLT